MHAKSEHLLEYASIALLRDAIEFRLQGYTILVSHKTPDWGARFLVLDVNSIVVVITRLL